MKNNLQRWRASHPLFIITCYILIGYVFSINTFSNTFLEQYTNQLEKLLLFTLLILFFNIGCIKNKLINGILIILVLGIWGIWLPPIVSKIEFFGNLPNTPFILYCRNWIMQRMDLYITDRASNAFAKALLIGIKSPMDKELQYAYQQLGIVHIIAISGMHLEILFKALLQITSWLPRIRIFKIIEIIILLFCVWIYTCIAFASPSILRASIFFSILLIGQFFNLNKFALNSFAAGLLLVLFFNSKTISHIGLQLSYAAVIGIFLFYKIIYKSLVIDNLILKFLWSNLSISIAAQLTTLPIIIYYFHTSTSLSIIGNFLMVPLSNLVLYSLAVFLVSPPCFELPTVSGKIASYLIQNTNQLALYLNQVLDRGIQHYQITIIEMILYYISLFCIYQWLIKKDTQYLFYVMVVIAIVMLLKLFS